MYNFKFPLGAILRDKEVLDEVLIVGRLLDVDDNNAPIYMVKRPHRLDYHSASAVEEWFDLSPCDDNFQLVLTGAEMPLIL